MQRNILIWNTLYMGIRDYIFILATSWSNIVVKSPTWTPKTCIL